MPLTQRKIKQNLNEVYPLFYIKHAVAHAFKKKIHKTQKNEFY